MVLVLKLILVPSLIAMVTLATRRWGPRVGGLLMAMPVVAGPTLAFYAVEQGTTFAAEATEATLDRYAAQNVNFVPVVSPHSGPRRAERAKEIQATSRGAPGISRGGAPWLVGLIGVGAFCVSYARSAARWNWLPSLLIGWFTFGVVTVVPVAARRFLRAFIPGLCTFGVFCFVLSPALRRFSLPVAFGVTLFVQLMLQGIILWLPLRTAASDSAVHPSAAADVVGR